MYNLEYRVLDKLGRTKKTLWGGMFKGLNELEDGKQSILNKNKKLHIAFDVYIIDKHWTHLCVNDRNNI